MTWIEADGSAAASPFCRQAEGAGSPQRSIVAVTFRTLFQRPAGRVALQPFGGISR